MNKNSKIFSILNTYFQQIARSRSENTWADDVKNMWDATTPDHRHLILDLIAHTKIYDGSIARSWGKLNALGVLPSGLSVVMNALAVNVPLTHAQGYTPDLFPMEAQEKLAREIEVHNAWRTNNPYWCDTQFVEDGSNDGDSSTGNTMVIVPLISQDGRVFLEALCAVLMAPVAAAPATVAYLTDKKNVSLTRRTPISVLPGATMFWHQCNLYGSYNVVRAVALGNLPAQVVKKYSTQGLGSFTCEDYLLWADTMEHFFPVRERAVRWVTEGKGYYVWWRYVKDRAAGHATSIFKDLDDFPNHIPVSTQLWLVERHQPALTYDVDTYTL